MSAPKSSQRVGSFALVLHSHLPWLAHHGSWPVGEEWLYQSWATSYVPVFDVLARLASEGRRDLVTLGMTPVLAAQLDDPYCAEAFHTWLGFWAERAHQLAGHHDGLSQGVGSYEALVARRTAESFESTWSAGGSAAIRPLIDAGAIELLGGPAAHPFQPLLDEQVAAFSLRTGLDDAELRIGHRPTGIWAPECGYRPGLEDLYQRAGVTHFLVDGPTLLHVGASPADAWTIGDSDVVAVGRDLEVTYRVWSPRRGYPGGPWYRDFHTFDHDTGIRTKRVTSTRTESADKALYDPAAAAAAVDRDADDFVTVVRDRLVDLAGARDGREALVVAAYDTELFGHWWHEGPAWLEAVLRRLPEAGVNVTTVSKAIADGAVAGAAHPQNGSWGSGKDWSVWAGDQVGTIVADNDDLQRRWRKVASAATSGPDAITTADAALNQLARDGLLALSSDWAFMVTKDSAAQYALDRHRGHHSDFHRLAALVEAALDGDLNARRAAATLAQVQGGANRPFGHINGRLLAEQDH
ncbi:MAG: 1,4-alpha-glucan branching protein domain-containing protein [Actinomycetes bacterium]